MSRAMIHAEGLTRRFGPIVAVDRIDLDIDQRGIVGFLGPNGAGKTTTMRMLTGYLPMSDGHASVAGFDVFDDPISVKAHVGYLPETPPLYPELTVGEYLAFVAEIRGIPRAERLEAVGRVMERVGLHGWEGRLLSDLSKGYRQRVGLAQALVHDPPVLILDEPTSGLDPAQLVAIRGLIRELSADHVVVFSTHVLAEVERLCDRVILIHRGRIVGDGTVEDLASHTGSGGWTELHLDAPETGVSEVAALEVVKSVEVLDSAAGLRLRVEGDGVVPAITELAVGRGWPVEQVIPHPPSLQEVFLQLVSGDVEAVTGAPPPAPSEAAPDLPDRPLPGFAAATWAVFRKELRVYFLSPLAWAFLAAFLFLSGLFFYLGIALTGEASMRAMMGNLAVVLLFCLPLLTMRQIANETRQGTLELLLTAPVPIGALILGKWLATQVICLCLLAFTGLYPVVLFAFGDPDPGVLFTSYLGLLACCGAFSAAGLFTSSLTRDQMVAGVMGIVLLLPFWLASAARDLVSDELRPLLDRVSFLEHLRSFARGVIDTGDIAWFAGFTFLFLFLTWRSLESRRWR